MNSNIHRNFIFRALVAAMVFSLGVTTVAQAEEQGGVLGSKRKVPFALKGNIYFLEPGTSHLPDLSQLTRKGTIYARELNVTPRSFSEGFPGVTDRFEWFAIEYKGTFWIKSPGKYKFRLTSDDGAVLLVDGRKLIDNDGVHPPRSKEKSIDLRRGLHKILLQYFQGPRYEIALVLEVAREGEEYGVFKPEEMARINKDNWLEELMDTTTLLATYALLAFLVERLTNGVSLLLSYLNWWRVRFDVTTAADTARRGKIDRNRRVALFFLGAVVAVVGTILVKLNLLAQIGIDGVPAIADQILTGLLIASGGDPIREIIQKRERRGEEPPPTSPLQVTGTLVLQQSGPIASEKVEPDKEESS